MIEETDGRRMRKRFLRKKTSNVFALESSDNSTNKGNAVSVGSKLPPIDSPRRSSRPTIYIRVCKYSTLRTRISYSRFRRPNTYQNSLLNSYEANYIGQNPLHEYSRMLRVRVRSGGPQRVPKIGLWYVLRTTYSRLSVHASR